MKAVLMFVFITMFLVGSALAAGHVRACPDMIKPAAQPGMPCHDAMPHVTQKHCAGVCLCQHAALMHSVLPAGTVVFYVPAAAHERAAMAHQPVQSRTLLPPRRPPKLL